MTISVNYITKVISIPQADLTFVSGTLYELDTNQFKQDLAGLQDDEEGMPFLDMFLHSGEVTVAGTTFARSIEIINGYSVEFEDGQYSVRLINSNNNIFDVENGILVQNQVQLIATNSGGLIVNDAASISPTQQQIRDAMELDTTGGDSSVDSKLDNNFSISAAGV